MIFQESLEVAAAGVELPLGHADDQRLCEFEEAAAFSTAVDRQLGACAVWLEPLVDFEEVRPSGGRGGQLLVLDESRARGRRFVASAQERAYMDHCAAHFERVFAGPLHFQQSRSPQRGLGDVPHRCENVLDGAVDDRGDLKFIHFSSDLCPFLLSCLRSQRQSKAGRVLARRMPVVAAALAAGRLPPHAHGSGSPSSPPPSPAPPRTAPSPSSKPTSANGSPSGTKTPGRSCGPRPRMRSSNPSPPTANESATQDTRS